MEMKRLSAMKIITQECFLWEEENKQTNKNSSASGATTYFSLLAGMVGMALDVQKWLWFSKVLLQLRAGGGVSCWVCCH